MQRKFFSMTGAPAVLAAARAVLVALALAGCNPDPTPTVTGVTVTAVNDATTVVKGSTLQFRATVVGENSPDQTVTWNIIGNVVSGTGINGTGLLTVAEAETAASITVQATSTADKGKFGTKEVSVNGSLPMVVTSVTVTAANDATTVVKGETLQFYATVVGENSPDQTVTWSITGSVVSGTAIDATTGLLTVAPGETVGSTITVRATSTVNTGKIGTKDVNVISTERLIEMVSIPGGTFTMGSPETDANSDSTEKPQHQVSVSPFYMGKYEITQKQYLTVMGYSLPTGYYTVGEGDNYPVYKVNWYAAIVFCNKLSIMEGLTPAYTIGGSTNPRDWGSIPSYSSPAWDAATVNWNADGYRLPTEAEWEYACRAGTTMAYNTGDMITEETGWYNDNSEGMTHEVGQKPANNFGLYDMHGNVYEWCWDGFNSYWNITAEEDPHDDITTNLRVKRGGAWSEAGERLRSAYRGSSIPGYEVTNNGFRLVHR